MENDKDVIQWDRHAEIDIMFKYTQSGPKKLSYSDEIIVKEGEVAIFTHDGKLADALEIGKHAINNTNLPILSEIKIRKKEKTYEADVYFIDTNLSKGHIWGSSAPVSVNDKNISDVSVGVIGRYDYQIANYKLFVKRIAPKFDTFSRIDLDKYIKPRILTEFINAVNELHVSIFEIEEYYLAISSIMEEKLYEIFSGLGLTLKNIIIDEVHLPKILKDALNKNKYNELTSDSFSKTDFDPSLGLITVSNNRDEESNTKPKPSVRTKNLTIVQPTMELIEEEKIDDIETNDSDKLNQNHSEYELSGLNPKHEQGFDEFKLSDENLSEGIGNEDFKLIEETINNVEFKLNTGNESTKLTDTIEDMVETISNVNRFILHENSEQTEYNKRAPKIETTLKYEQFNLEEEKQDTIRRYNEKINNTAIAIEEEKNVNIKEVSLDNTITMSYAESVKSRADNSLERLNVVTIARENNKSDIDETDEEIQEETTLTLDSVHVNMYSRENTSEFKVSFELIDDNSTNITDQEKTNDKNEEDVAFSLYSIKGDIGNNEDNIADKLSLDKVKDSSSIEEANTNDSIETDSIFNLDVNHENVTQNHETSDFTISLDPLDEDNAENDFNINIPKEDVEDIFDDSDDFLMSFELPNEELIDFKKLDKIRNDLDDGLEKFANSKDDNSSSNEEYEFASTDSFDDYDNKVFHKDEIDENLYSIEPPESEKYVDNSIKNLIHRKKELNFFEVEDEVEDMSSEINQPLITEEEADENYSDQPYLDLVAERQKNNSSKLLDASRTSAFIVQRKREEESKKELNKKHIEEMKSKSSKSQDVTNGAYTPGVKTYEYDFSASSGGTSAEQRKKLRTQMMNKLGGSSSTANIFVHTNNQVESRVVSSFSRSTSKITERMCPHCAALIPESSTFCRFCGESTKVVKKTCPNCSEHVSGKAKYCSMCGTKL